MTRFHRPTCAPALPARLRRLRPGFAAALAAPVLTAACHAYAPSRLGQVNPGDQVRALLTQDQFDHFSESLPTGDERLIEGLVVETGPGELLLEVPVVTRLEGIRVTSYSQRLRVPEAGIADLELRSLARGRTYGLAAAAAALVGWIVWDQFLSDSGRGPDPGPPSIIDFTNR